MARKISPTPGFDPLTIQPVACSYTALYFNTTKNVKVFAHIQLAPYDICNENSCMQIQILTAYTPKKETI